MTAIILTKFEGSGKVYLAGADIESYIPDESRVGQKIDQLRTEMGLTVPDEPLPAQGTLGFRVQVYGILKWKDLFTSRQLLALLTFTSEIHHAYDTMLKEEIDPEKATAITTYLGLMVDKLADFNSNLCRWVHDPEQSFRTNIRTDAKGWSTTVRSRPAK